MVVTTTRADGERRQLDEERCWLDRESNAGTARSGGRAPRDPPHAQDCPRGSVAFPVGRASPVQPGWNTSGAMRSASGTSPTTSPDPSSRPADSDPAYTLDCEEPDVVAVAGAAASPEQ